MERTRREPQGESAETDGIRRDLQTKALVSVAEESSEQVAFVGRRVRVPMEIHAGKNDDVVLISSEFLPKNCQLKIELPGVDPVQALRAE